MTESWERNERALAIIPARGGSKRVIRKNIRLFAGEPAIVHTIRAALDSGCFARVVVSTDDAEVADIALRCGAEVPFVRASSLADDHVPVSLATVDALERTDPGATVTVVAQLMANCPLRTAADVRDSYTAFRERQVVAQISVTRFGWQNPWWAFQQEADGVLIPLFPERTTQRSQDLPSLVCPTGAIWWARADVLRRERTFHVAGRVGWEMPWARGVDIDTEEDWAFAAALLEARGAHVP